MNRWRVIIAVGGGLALLAVVWLGLSAETGVPASAPAVQPAAGESSTQVFTNTVTLAPPFSDIATPFRVAAGRLTYDANCAWDAYGVAAALHADIDAADGHTGEPIRLLVRDGRPPTPFWAI
jgi:hypothetical protein